MKNARKVLAKMLSSKDAASWLVAADLIHEEALVPYDDAAIRRRAEWTLAIARRFEEANRVVGNVQRRTLPLSRGVSLFVHGGERTLLGYLTFRGPEVTYVNEKGGVRIHLHKGTRSDNRVSPLFNLRRDLLAREEYRTRRAAELADELLWPKCEYTRAALVALGVNLED